jgi:hypothetical protein
MRSLYAVLLKHNWKQELGLYVKAKAKSRSLCGLSLNKEGVDAMSAKHVGHMDPGEHERWKVMGVAFSGADEIRDPEHKSVSMELWDTKLIKAFRGSAEVPLKDVLDSGRIRDTYK